MISVASRLPSSGAVPFKIKLGIAPPHAMFLLLCPHDADSDGARRWHGPLVVGQTVVYVLQLTWASLTLELFVHLIDHAQASCSNGMAEALQASIRLNR